ncbi:MAG: hypothetical protein HZB23_15720 [Deltaproteobacteria bacterium]|nr:hypothetical protein [Deltaproteobacteria bacterium]
MARATRSPYGYDEKGRMNQDSWNIGGTADPGNPGAPVTGGVPGRTD